MKGYVYFARVGDFIKVGYTAFPGRRFLTLRGSMILCVKGSLAKESRAVKWMQNNYGKASKGREWFHVTEAVFKPPTHFGKAVPWEELKPLIRGQEKVMVAISGSSYRLLKSHCNKTGRFLGGAADRAIVSAYGKQASA